MEHATSNEQCVADRVCSARRRHPAGYSTGRWDGDSLVGETTDIGASSLDGRGTPQSSSIHLHERFTPASDGSPLDYRLTVTDPITFTEPLEVERFWIWRPEIAVGSYACGEEHQFRK